MRLVLQRRESCPRETLQCIPSSVSAAALERLSTSPSPYAAIEPTMAAAGALWVTTVDSSTLP